MTLNYTCSINKETQMAKRNRRVNSNRQDIGAVISEILNEYADEITGDISPVVKKTADEAVRNIETAAPRRRKGTEGYYNSWNVEKANVTRYETSYVIYSNQPGLPHLLEFGHASRNGGRVGPSPAGGHIAPAEKKAAEELERRILEVINNAG